MGVNRITSGFMSKQSIHFLNNNLLSLSNLQEKLSSGQNINQPSDDPVGLTRILDISNTLRVDERYKRNIETAIAEVNTVDTVLNNMVTLVHRVQELTTQAANFTNNQDGRDAIALEVDQIISQLVQLGNTDVGGKYVFGGARTDAPPFERVSQYQIDYNGNAPAENWQRQVEIAKGITLTININGESLLGTANGAAGALPVGVAGSGLFQTLTELLIDLQSGGDVLQLDEIRNRLDDLTTDLADLAASQSVIGSTTNRLELTLGRIEERKAIFTKQYAEIQEIDVAETIANMNHHENLFQASLGVTARVIQTSLLNFLR